MSPHLPFRVALDRTIKIASCLCALAALYLLAWILITLVVRGGEALSISVFTHEMAPPGRGGGLANAIVGSLLQVGLALIIATPVGILAGIFLAEIATHSRFGKIMRLVNDILLSAPSVLIGLYVYQLIVRPFGFSGIGGAVALSVIILPVIVRSTEDMLRLIPNALREAAFALGAPHWHVVLKVLLRGARTGIMTGILLAVARAAGETAPLLFTSLGNDFWSFNLLGPMSSLPVAINKYAASPSNEWVALAWAGALIITAGVLLLNIISRLLIFHGKKV